MGKFGGRSGGDRQQHRHDDVDRAQRHQQMAAAAKPGPQFVRHPFDLAEWDRQHHEAEQQTLHYGPNVYAQEE